MPNVILAVEPGSPERNGGTWLNEEIKSYHVFKGAAYQSLSRRPNPANRLDGSTARPVPRSYLIRDFRPFPERTGTVRDRAHARLKTV
jgi:hypothetical protein